MQLRERVEHFGDALTLLAQSDDRRDRQAAAHQLLAEFVRPYLPNAKQHHDALSRLERMVRAESDSRPELVFLPYVRKIIANTSPKKENLKTHLHPSRVFALYSACPDKAAAEKMSALREFSSTGVERYCTSDALASAQAGHSQPIHDVLDGTYSPSATLQLFAPSAAPCAPINNVPLGFGATCSNAASAQSANKPMALGPSRWGSSCTSSRLA